MKKKAVVWFSCGAASAVAAKLTVEKYSEEFEVVIVNTPVIEEDEDNLRFFRDVEAWIGKEIQIATNRKFPENSAEAVWKKERYMSGVKGATCTKHLKKGARYQYELENEIAFHVLGFTADEIHRHKEFTRSERENVIPVLIDEGLSKNDCFQIVEDAGILLPRSYRIGFPNANCIGCVKSASPTYWNLVRVKYPEVFERRAKLSRLLGVRLVMLKGVRIFLDELPPDAIGRKIKSWECGIFCDTD